MNPTWIWCLIRMCASKSVVVRNVWKYVNGFNYEYSPVNTTKCVQSCKLWEKNVGKPSALWARLICLPITPRLSADQSQWGHWCAIRGSSPCWDTCLLNARRHALTFPYEVEHLAHWSRSSLGVPAHKLIILSHNKQTKWSNRFHITNFLTLMCQLQFRTLPYSSLNCANNHFRHAHSVYV